MLTYAQGNPPKIHNKLTHLLIHPNKKLTKQLKNSTTKNHRPKQPQKNTHFEDKSLEMADMEEAEVDIDCQRKKRCNFVREFRN